MREVNVWYNRCEDGYFFMVTGNSMKQIFVDISKYGYALVYDPYAVRMFGMKLRAFRVAGVFLIGWDKLKNITIIALSPKYKIKQDDENENKFYLYER